jgi:hypothetical protein
MKTAAQLLRLSGFALAAAATASRSHSAAVDDGRGREWRQLTETTGLSWEQVVQVSPQDGESPITGSVGGRNLTGWVWATDAQVAELFSLWAPTILDSPTWSVGGWEYLGFATQFQSVFQVTQHVQGCPTYQPCWAARTGGATAPAVGAVASDSWAMVPSGRFSIAESAATASPTRGVFLWRPTGLLDGGLYANDDQGQSPSPHGGLAVDVLANDWLAGAHPTAATVSVSLVSSAVPGLTLGADGIVVVAAGTAAGTQALTYQICDSANPTRCATATATITVRSYAIAAKNDQGTVSFAQGGIGVANVLANDTLGGVAATPAIVTLEQVAASHPGISLNVAIGTVMVSPNTPHGAHTLTYRIAERANPANTALATVSLTPFSIDAVNDSWRLSSKTGGTSPSVLANDWFNGTRATTTKVKISLVSALPKGVTFNTATGTFTVAPKTSSGTYRLTYQLSEIGSPANIDQAIITLDLSGKSS